MKHDLYGVHVLYNILGHALNSGLIYMCVALSAELNTSNIICNLEILDQFLDYKNGSKTCELAQY